MPDKRVKYIDRELFELLVASIVDAADVAIPASRHPEEVALRAIIDAKVRKYGLA